MQASLHGKYKTTASYVHIGRNWSDCSGGHLRSESGGDPGLCLGGAGHACLIARLDEVVLAVRKVAALFPIGAVTMGFPMHAKFSFVARMQMKVTATVRE